MYQKLEKDLKKIIFSLYQSDLAMLDKLILELPPEKLENEFDYSTNIALVLSKSVGKNPMEIEESNSLYENIFWKCFTFR